MVAKEELSSSLNPVLCAMQDQRVGCHKAVDPMFVANVIDIAGFFCAPIHPIDFLHRFPKVTLIEVLSYHLSLCFGLFRFAKPFSPSKPRV